MTPNFRVLLHYQCSTTASVVTVKKLNPSFICNQTSWVTFWPRTNLPIGVSFSHLFLAAAEYWVLCCSCYFLHGLDHEMHSKNVIKYWMRQTWMEKSWREWFILNRVLNTCAFLHASLCPESYKPFRKRNPESYIFTDKHLALGVKC